MSEPKQINTTQALLPNLPNYDPEPADGVRVGESPVPGLTLRRILRGHTSWINRIAWSPDGRFLASPSHDKTIRIWDVTRGECTAILEGHRNNVNTVAWSSDNHMLASGSSNGSIWLWDIANEAPQGELFNHASEVTSVNWSPNGRLLASASDDGTLITWEPKKKKVLWRSKDHGRWITAVAWSPDGSLLASSCGDATIGIWSVDGKSLNTLRGHNGRVTNLAWSQDGQSLISSSIDATMRIWEPNTGKQVRVIEGHTATVRSVSYSFDRTLIASNSWDSTFRLWRCDSWEEVAILQSRVENNWAASLAFHPNLPLLATLSDWNTAIQIWELNYDELISGTTHTTSVRYTTAKLVLVGDSGVGKTGLGWRLAHGAFKEHTSTHGQQFWVVDELGQTLADGTECEAVPWDLAGQHVYRPIHAIFLDDVDASLVLFDPTNRQEPLKGAEFWLEQLAHKKKLPPSVLVGARLDRGASTLSQEELAQFCQKHSINGGYIGTSAKEGLGLENLLETLKDQIPWDQMTSTVTTRTFKRVKEYVLSLKEKPDRQGVLVNPTELRQQLEATDPDWAFTDTEMMTAVGHLQTHGYVTVLHSSSGQQHVLLTPELLVDLASSIVLQADKHPRELGALNETELLQGRYPLPELSDLETEEQQILLDAAVTRFLEHKICFRETLGNDTLLIFPGLIKQKRPLQDEVEAVDDISYIVRGRVENVYPALVVLLGFTRTFTRVNQWQRQAQYERRDSNICGFRLIEDVESEIELVLYYSIAMPEYGRHQFQGLFEEFLYQRDVEVTRFPPVRCPDDHLQERSTVVKRIREGKQFLFCEECGKRIDLPDIEKQPEAGALATDWIQREEALARLRSTYETYLTRVKGFRRDRAAPRCYLSHLPAQAEWTDQLTNDLRDAGVHVITNRDDLGDDDFILIADTPAYQQAFQGTTDLLATDAALIRRRWRQDKESNIIQLLLESKEKPPTTTFIQSNDFRRDSYYAVNLFDLVLTLYAISLTHPAFAAFRTSLHQQWQLSLAGKVDSVETVEKQAKQNQAKFLQLLDSHFNESELKKLCFGLSIDFENLPGETKEDKARELMLYCERYGRLDGLQGAVRERRPQVQWPEI